ncbi:hypothetical protein MMC22_004083 [Lobaria immixta]|nr:hypothetical protein [Lobaria immixta]
MSSKSDAYDREADPLKLYGGSVTERKHDGSAVMKTGEEEASSSRTPYMKKYPSFPKQSGRERGRGRGRESQEDDLEMGTPRDTRGTGSPSGCPARYPPGCLPECPKLDPPRQEIEGLVQQSGENLGKPRKKTDQEWKETLKPKRQFMIGTAAVSFWILHITAALGFPLVTNAIGYNTEPASSDKILAQW